MADKKIVDLEELAFVDSETSFLVIDNGIQTYKIKPINVPGLPQTPNTILELSVSDGVTLNGYQAFGIAYMDKDGQWRLRFNLNLILNSTTDTSWLCSIVGVTFKEDITNQAVSISSASANLNSYHAVAEGGSGDIRVRISNGSPGDYSLISISGDVLLEEMPEWVDAETFRRAEGFQTRMAGAVDSVNGMIGDVNLTTSDIPEGSRPYFTDSRAQNAAVQDMITPGVANRAPSQKSVATALDAKQSLAQKNANNGYAGLDGSGKLPLSTIPSAILGALSYQGSWNASTGVYPGSPAKGQYWIVTVAGTISGVAYSVKDWMVFNGASWDRVSGAEASAVTTVNGQSGDVYLDTDDINEGANKYFSDALARGAAVADSITDGVIDVAPSQNAVFDALASLTASIDADLDDKQDRSERGSPDGYAPLDSDGMIPDEFLPPSTGSGEKTYFTEGVNDAAGWTASGAGIGVQTWTTVADLPDNATQESGIRILRASGTDYVTLQKAGVRARLDDLDLNKRLKVQFDMRYAGNAGDYSVKVFAFAASTGGVGTEIAVNNPLLPGSGYVGTVKPSFTAPTSALPYIEVRIYGNAGTTPLYVNNFLVGPGVLGRRTPVGNWQDWTPTGSFTNATYTGRKWRVGPTGFYQVKVVMTGAPGPTNLNINQPNGETIDFDNLILRYNSAKIGDATLRDSGINPFIGTVGYGSTTSVVVMNPVVSGSNIVNPAAASNSVPFAFNTGDEIYVTWSVPIAEWAGSGDTTGDGANVEYACNTSTNNTTSDLTSFSSSSNGAPIGSITAALRRRMRFATPIQNINDLQIQVRHPDTGVWIPAKGALRTAAGADRALEGYQSRNDIKYGIGLYMAAGMPNTDIDVFFGQYPNGNSATYGGAGDTWAAAWGAANLRVRKVDPASPVGIELATATRDGMVSGNGGYPGSQTGQPIPAGKIGQIIRETTAGSIATPLGTPTEIQAVALGLGTWALTGHATTSITGGNATTIISTQLEVSSSSGSIVDNESNQGNISYPGAVGGRGNSGELVITLSAPDTLRLNALTTNIGGTAPTTVSVTNRVLKAKRIG